MIQYVFLYAYNPPYTVGPFSLGAHDCDIEHATLRVRKKDLRIVEMFYSAHRSTDGVWVPVEQMELHQTTHPILYIAKGSHAIYPKESVYIRIIGFANDHTSRDGIEYHPERESIVLIDKNTIWNCFNTSTCKAPVYHEWWGAENGVSTNWLGRLLGMS